MSLRAVFDPLFMVPCLNGLLTSVLLAVLGCYARIRDEWLASLGLAQASAAGVAVWSLFLSPGPMAAVAAAGAAATAKTAFGRKGNDSYALMMLAGWSLAILAVANSSRGGELGRTISEGQLFFTGTGHLEGIAMLAAAAAGALPFLSPRLLLQRFFPYHFERKGPFRPAHDLFFDILFALVLAFSALVTGVMGAFAFVFVPPWLAFRAAKGWKRTLALAALLATAGYLASFAAAIAFNQPIGPVMAAVMSVLCLAGIRHRRSPAFARSSADRTGARPHGTILPGPASCYENGQDAGTPRRRVEP